MKKILLSMLLIGSLSSYVFANTDNFLINMKVTEIEDTFYGKVYKNLKQNNNFILLNKGNIFLFGNTKINNKLYNVLKVKQQQIKEINFTGGINYINLFGIKNGIKKLNSNIKINFNLLNTGYNFILPIRYVEDNNGNYKVSIGKIKTSDNLKNVLNKNNSLVTGLAMNINKTYNLNYFKTTLLTNYINEENGNLVLQIGKWLKDHNIKLSNSQYNLNTLYTSKIILRKLKKNVYGTKINFNNLNLYIYLYKNKGLYIFKIKGIIGTKNLKFRFTLYKVFGNNKVKQNIIYIKANLVLLNNPFTNLYSLIGNKTTPPLILNFNTLYKSIGVLSKKELNVFKDKLYLHLNINSNYLCNFNLNINGNGFSAIKILK